MTGPGNYRAADAALRNAGQRASGEGWDGPRTRNLLLYALVHATLSLTAAVIDTTNRRPDNADAWQEVLHAD